MYTPVNSTFKDDDLSLWKQYKASPTPQNREALLKRFDGVIQSQVNKWSGNMPRDVLLTKAKTLAAKAFDTYNPNAGAALATHLTNSLMPLSRLVYTYQNTARMPENITIQMNTYNQAVSHLTAVNGREPTTDELHDELGWSSSQISRVRDYNRRDLLESGQAVNGDFYAGGSNDDDDDIILGGIYMELSPEEKTLFEYITGWNGKPKLSNPEIIKRTGMTQAQLSYKKTLLTNKINSIMSRPGVRHTYSGGSR